MDTANPSKQMRWKKRSLGSTTYGTTAINAATAFAKGTKGKPHPLNVPAIVGDAQADGKVNPEVVVAVEKGPNKGLHVMPIKDMHGAAMAHYSEGTKTVAVVKKRTPRVDGRVIATKPAPNPSAPVDRGLDAHNRTSMIKSLDRMKRYAYGTGPGPRYYNPNRPGVPRPTIFKPRVTDGMTGQVQPARNFLPTEAPPVPVMAGGGGMSDFGDGGMPPPRATSTGMSVGGARPRMSFRRQMG